VLGVRGREHRVKWRVDDERWGGDMGEFLAPIQARLIRERVGSDRAAVAGVGADALLQRPKLVGAEVPAGSSRSGASRSRSWTSVPPSDIPTT
jgi:hypothetical protein